VGIKGGIDLYVIPCKVKGNVLGNKHELRGKTTGCKRYKVEEGLFKGCKWQVEPPKNKQAWGRRESGGKKVCKPPRQYPEALKVLQNRESKYSRVCSPFFILLPSLCPIPYSLVEITYRKVGLVVHNKPLSSLFLV
jgi:hypothetical protein